MKPETDKAICAIMGTDESITQRHAQAALAILRGTATKEEAPIDKIVTRDEAADMLRVTPVTVSNWARRGDIRRIIIKGRTIGYSYLSIKSIIDGQSDKHVSKGA